MGTTIKLSGKPLTQWPCADLRRDYMWINNSRPFNNNGVMTNDVREMLKSVGLGHLESKYTSLMVLRTPTEDHEAIWGFSGSPVAEGLMADLLYTEIKDVTLKVGVGKFYNRNLIYVIGHHPITYSQFQTLRIYTYETKKYFDLPIELIEPKRQPDFVEVTIPGWYYKLIYHEKIEPCLIKPPKKKV